MLHLLVNGSLVAIMIFCIAIVVIGSVMLFARFR
jgi:hypothetical protein